MRRIWIIPFLTSFFAATFRLRENRGVYRKLSCGLGNICNHECAGKSPDAEKECRAKCLRRLREIEECSRRNKEEFEKIARDDKRRRLLDRIDNPHRDLVE